ncbi:DUF6708 domain-containing protein [Nissabacter sp. SGAir0207]|uniref:DUF6708 domain-containing protein n=1 Tax=Nissabacter sp. SGAir0207 TaxID=2126321 RepID=UPI0010CCFF80|nr:DUF6708 domain-containing protein [Nissabacter sp. SGAir0207]QCR35374.1 hypothetical protein C1N62_04355 [Nissabacter sp. SGAir0207]
MKQSRPPTRWYDDMEAHHAALRAYFARTPRLAPRLKNWQEDLPPNQSVQTAPAKLIHVTEINDIWMELPRYQNIMWGCAWVGVITTALPFAFMASIALRILYDCLIEGNVRYFIVFLSLLIGSGLFMSSMFLLNLKMALYVPRDQPIRFNRARQKIYVFDYHRTWNPWAHWSASVRVFDWADVYGELAYDPDRYSQGYPLFCAVCKPGTHEVLERFELSRAMLNPEPQRRLWSFCCQYMQYKEADRTPLLPGRPDSWVPRASQRWPEEIERESSSAPGEEQE